MKHSKDYDIYCYSIDGNVCFTLTHGNISFWALEIVHHCVLISFKRTNLSFIQIKDNMTIEGKPVTLYLHMVRPLSQASAPHFPDQIKFSGPYMMAPPGIYSYPQSPVTMPIWGSGQHAFWPPGQYFKIQSPMTSSKSTQAMSASSSATTSQLQLSSLMLFLGLHILTSRRNIVRMASCLHHMELDSKPKAFLYLSTNFGVHSTEKFAGLAWD
jgi:hypothetical protein